MLPSATDAVRQILSDCFNGHPPLGVNATGICKHALMAYGWQFQTAPTLGGECYLTALLSLETAQEEFQWAPTLGGECYWHRIPKDYNPQLGVSMGTHPWG